MKARGTGKQSTGSPDLTSLSIQVLAEDGNLFALPNFQVLVINVHSVTLLEISTHLLFVTSN